MEQPCEDFFAENPPPRNLSDVDREIEAFCAVQSSDQILVLVTSGGTTIPFEKNTVRFIDNFSQGTRGSASAEHFLTHDKCSVIFLYRSTTLRPFMRHFTTTNFLDMLELDKEDIKVTGSHRSLVRKLLDQYRDVKEKTRLLEVPFTTLSDYLWLLKTACHHLNNCGPKAMLYLAAAVSDFYIPAQKMSEHKIQSSEGAPTVQLKIVPKMLTPLVNNWAPSAFVVSFKLETDESILIQKAKKALATYKHKIVVANLLHTRKEKVLLVHLHQPEVEPIIMTPEELASGQEIEEKIVANLWSKHLQLISLQ